MSLLINGIDMPKCCDDCTFYQDDVFPACKFLWDDFDNYRYPAVERDRNCPLSEVPTPHGRLIDADRLIKALEKQWNVDDDQDFANKTVWREIESAPTVIEKEMN